VCGITAVVYDNGTLFDVAILDITDDDIRSRFLEVTYLNPFKHSSVKWLHFKALSAIRV